MKKKKQKSTFLVVLTILLLAVIIALPPIFRVLFPRTENSGINKNIKTILLCQRDSQAENLSIIVKTSYLDDDPKSTLITYKQLKNTVNNTTDTIDNASGESTGTNNDEVIQNYFSVTDQLILFKSLVDVTYRENDDGSTSVIINPKSLKSNPTKTVLTNYFNKFENVRDYFVSQGYTCSMTNS